MESTSTAIAVGPTDALTNPITFRNSRFLVFVTMFGALVGVLIAVGMTILAITQTFPFRGYSWGRALGVASWAFSGCCTGSMALFLWHIGLTMSRNQARMDRDGISFRLGPKDAEQTQFFKWGDIAGICHTQTGNCQCYSIRGTDGNTTEFTSYTFFRPKKLATDIARNSGQAIVEAG